MPSVIVLAVLAALLALGVGPAAAEEGDADATEAAELDLFHVTPADAARLRAAATKPAPLAAPYGQLVLRTLSNRADLISGGDVLVEVVVPSDVSPALVRVTLNGDDVTSAFAVRADGRFTGLLTGLGLGANEVGAYALPNPQSNRPGGRSAARLTITNHPASGPVFSGPQLQPWVCAQPTATPTNVTIFGSVPLLTATVNSRASGLLEATDANCQAAPRYTYWYQPKEREGGTCVFTNTGGTRCFEPYDPASPPAPEAIADFVNDRGDVAKSIVRVERGTINRSIYELVTMYDPDRPVEAWAPPSGWNGKLLWIFGASSGVSRFQSPPANSVWNNTALRRGFMVATSSLTDHGTNANDQLGAETVMMLKERIAERYGPIRYTMGAGCSGGSIMQLNIASAYPGLLDGIQPNCTYPDTLTTAIEVSDCGLLQSRYYGTANGAALSTAKRNAINGHQTALISACASWVSAFLPSFNPSNAGNCGSGWPAALTFDKVLRPQGVRCTATDHGAAMFGTTTGADGITRANAPLDNVGVQYGLKALQAGTITAEEFVRLNEGIGSYTSDFEWVPPARTAASDFALKMSYTGGIVTDGRQLAKTAIIDLRGNESLIGEIHLNWRAWSVRDRLDRANGHHGNQVIWAFTGGGAAQPGAALGLLAFTTLDTWLANVEADASASPLEEKILAAKPATAIDRCLASNGATDAQVVANIPLDSAACPVKPFASPRQVAGGPRSEDVFKCQLKAIDASEYGVAMTDAQLDRLRAVFPDGVCDWSKPGVHQTGALGWVSFADGPGGEPLGPPPVSRGGCPGSSAGAGNARPGECPGQSAGPGR